MSKKARFASSQKKKQTVVLALQIKFRAIRFSHLFFDYLRLVFKFPELIAVYAEIYFSGRGNTVGVGHLMLLLSVF